MDREELKTLYFEWLYSLVYPQDKALSEEYRKTKLLWFLFETPFYSSIPQDEHRISDGLGLRYKFGDRFGYDDKTVLIYLDNRECSVLEMMVALAERCENQIMYDPEYGDRTTQWFRKMIASLGLNDMNNLHFDEMYVSKVIDRFLEHEYEPNGSGGLFALSAADMDMSTVEIWRQLCAYLNEYIAKEQYKQ